MVGRVPTGEAALAPHKKLGVRAIFQCDCARRLGDSCKCPLTVFTCILREESLDGGSGAHVKVVKPFVPRFHACYYDILRYISTIPGLLL